jgi:hypothetical protein
MERGTAVWVPLLPIDSEGGAELEFRAPDHPGVYRIRIDGHGTGRVGSLTRMLPIIEPAVAAEAEPAAAIPSIAPADEP